MAIFSSKVLNYQLVPTFFALGFAARTPADLLTRESKESEEELCGKPRR